jgi:hypothetical protein
MEESRAFWGAALRYLGAFLSMSGVTTASSHFALWFGHLFGALLASPEMFALAINGLAMATGYVLIHAGGLLRAIGRAHATTEIHR